MIHTVSDNTLARELLSSESFGAFDLYGYLLQIQEGSGQEFQALLELLPSVPAFLSGAHHLRLRKLAMHCLSPRRIKEWEPIFCERTALELDKVPTQECVDLVSGYIFPLVSKLIGRCMGVPDHHAEDVMVRSLLLADITENYRSLSQLRRMNERLTEMQATLLKVGIKNQELGLPPMLLPHLLANTDDEFTVVDALNLTLMHITASQNVIYTCAHVLQEVLVDRQLVKHLMADSDKCVDYLLRHRPAFTKLYRTCSSATELNGARFDKGDTALIDLPSVNGCPNIENSSEVISNSKSLSFGTGVHKCPGADFSKVVIKVALFELFARFPNISLLEVSKELTITAFSSSPTKVLCQLD